MWHNADLLNKRANMLFGICGLLLLLSGLYWFSQRPMFILKNITVVGMDNSPLNHVNKLLIKASALPRIKGNFFTVNLNTVRTAFESVPWVRQANVQREWPNKLIVSIEEHTALGSWGDNGRLLSVKGDIFTANLAEAEENGKLPEFNGPDGSEKEIVARFNEFKQWLAPIKLQPESLDLSKRYAWTLKLHNGPVIELGREETPKLLQTRMNRFIEVYPQLVEHLQNNIESIDMRYADGLALKVNGPIPGLNNKPHQVK